MWSLKCRIYGLTVTTFLTDLSQVPWETMALHYGNPNVANLEFTFPAGL